MDWPNAKSNEEHISLNYSTERDPSPSNSTAILNLPFAIPHYLMAISGPQLQSDWSNLLLLHLAQVSSLNTFQLSLYKDELRMPTAWMKTIYSYVYCK
jgi:hypothetical protein